MKLRDKKILIVGATGKLGAPITQACANAGAHVAAHGRKNKSSFRADIRDPREVKKLVRGAVKMLGGLDVVINCVGLFKRTPLARVSEKDWDEIIDTNLKAAFFLAKETAPHLKRSRGKIINIADTYGASPSATFVPYGISKAGIIAMTKGLAKELAPDVLVNCVCPGVIGLQADRPAGRQVREQRAVGATLLKRLVKAEDVVSAVLFLATNGSMTGQAVFVDGGR